MGLTTIVVFGRQMCTQRFVTSQDYNSISYLWDWSFLVMFGRQQNIQVQPLAAGKFENYD